MQVFPLSSFRLLGSVLGFLAQSVSIRPGGRPPPGVGRRHHGHQEVRGPPHARARSRKLPEIARIASGEMAARVGSRKPLLPPLASRVPRFPPNGDGHFRRIRPRFYDALPLNAHSTIRSLYPHPKVLQQNSIVHRNESGPESA